MEDFLSQRRIRNQTSRFKTLPCLPLKRLVCVSRAPRAPTSRLWACFRVSRCLGVLRLDISSSHKHAKRCRLPPFLILAFFFCCPSCCYQGCSAAHVSQSCNQRFYFWPVLLCSHSHMARKTTPLLHEAFAFSFIFLPQNLTTSLASSKSIGFCSGGKFCPCIELQCSI